MDTRCAHTSSQWRLHTSECRGVCEFYFTHVHKRTRQGLNIFGGSFTVRLCKEIKRSPESISCLQISFVGVVFLPRVTKWINNGDLSYLNKRRVTKWIVQALVRGTRSMVCNGTVCVWVCISVWCMEHLLMKKMTVTKNSTIWFPSIYSTHEYTYFIYADYTII